MSNTFTYVPYKETGYFSQLVTDYLSGNPDIAPFFQYAPDLSGLEQAIANRSNFPVDRGLLVNVLTRQYTGLSELPPVTANINALANENTYTVCTAHQPNLLTGYLYFVYKIIHAIRLAEELNALHPDKYFVPVYYMGSEDADIEELGTFRFRGDKYIWDGDGQKGAVGRMDTKGLKKILTDLFKFFGPPGKNCDDLQQLLTTAYLKHKTIGQATRYLVHELFGRFGLIVIDPDDADLKRTFVPVVREDLLKSNSIDIVSSQIEKLSAKYKIQAHPRAVNLFYLVDGMRERIEKTGDSWVVVNSDIQWSEAALLIELEQHPERFSPNVVLRGLFQETILPNVAFIGGGAEVAYWMQLKTLFAHHNVFYPAVFLRQSVMWIPPASSELYKKLGFTVAEIFKPESELQKEYLSKNSSVIWHTDDEAAGIEKVLNDLKQKAIALDPTLEGAVGAANARIQHQFDMLEKKMLRAEKRKNQVQMDRITRLREALFPNNSLQERVENFLEYYLTYGPSFFDVIKQGIRPTKNEFLVIE